MSRTCWLSPSASCSGTRTGNLPREITAQSCTFRLHPALCTSAPVRTHGSRAAPHVSTRATPRVAASVQGGCP
eukprot:2221913-Rhodomonas_salina.1